MKYCLLRQLALVESGCKGRSGGLRQFAGRYLIQAFFIDRKYISRYRYAVGNELLDTERWATDGRTPMMLPRSPIRGLAR